MKLILKRVGEDPRLMRTLEDGREYRDIPDPRPLALCAESGEQLPCQISTSLNSSGDHPLRVTVVFDVDGNNVVIQGDRKGVVYRPGEGPNKAIE